ncbi:MAG: hypothetical protein ACOYJC_00155 [Christensenellales bacterium]|jgi:hypothetical protein
MTKLSFLLLYVAFTLCLCACGNGAEQASVSASLTGRPAAPTPTPAPTDVLALSEEVYTCNSKLALQEGGNITTDITIRFPQVSFDNGLKNMDDINEQLAQGAHQVREFYRAMMEHEDSIQLAVEYDVLINDGDVLRLQFNGQANINGDAKDTVYEVEIDIRTAKETLKGEVRLALLGG